MNLFKCIRLSEIKPLLLFKRCTFYESSIEYEHNLNEIISCGYNNRVKFNEIHDLKISPNDWDKILMKWSDDKSNIQNLKRIPKLLSLKILSMEKQNLLDSFLFYLINDKTFHDPFILISVLLVTENINPYFDLYIQKYEEIVDDKVFEHLFNEYLTVLLMNPQHRNKAFNIMETRKRNFKDIYLLLKTTPTSEQWKNIKKYVEEFLQVSEHWYQDIEKSIFEKISVENSILILENILETLRNNDLYLQKDTVKLIEQQFKNTAGFQLNLDMTDGLLCKSCGSKLKDVSLSLENCNKVADYLMKNVMNIDSIEKLYQNCEPEEISRFLSFFKRCRLPLDCVIDFPNFACNTSYKIDFYSRKFCAKLIKNFEFLLKQKLGLKRICIIGKGSTNFTDRSLSILKEMLRPLELQYNAEFFFFTSKKNRKDDLLMLYLALKSGPDCYICSADEFRDHKARICDKNLHTFFSKWQVARQIVIKSEQNHIFRGPFLIPSAAHMAIQYDDIKGTWHIPYADSENSKLLLHGMVKWACLKMK